MAEIVEVKDKSNNGLNNIILSGNVFVEYRVLKNAWLNIAYQHNFSPTYQKAERYAGDAKNKLVKLGIRYYL